MFKDREDFNVSLGVLSSNLHEAYISSLVFDAWVGILEDYNLTKVDSRFMQKDFIRVVSHDDTKAYVSLGAALAGNMGNLGKTNADVYNDALQGETNYYSLELTTTTGVVVEVVAFKGENYSISFDADEKLNIYAFIIHADRNKQLLNHDNYFGRTLNLYGDVPTFIYAPSEGELHGIADYSNRIMSVDSMNKELESREGDFKGGVRSVEYAKLRKELEEKRVGKPVYMVYKDGASKRHISKSDCKLIDFNLYYRLESKGNNYEKTLEKVLLKNTKFTAMDDVVDMLDQYRKPIRHYRYTSREGVSLLDTFSEHISADVIRLDATSDRSSVSFKMSSSDFTSSYDYDKVGITFCIYSSEQFEFNLAEETIKYMDYIGFNESKHYVLYQAERGTAEWDKIYTTLTENYEVTELTNGAIEFRAQELGVEYRTFLIDTDFKYVDEVERL